MNLERILVISPIMRPDVTGGIAHLSYKWCSFHAENILSKKVCPMLLDQIYTEYKPMMFGLAYRMLGSAADAEDIVQDVFPTRADGSGKC